MTDRRRSARYVFLVPVGGRAHPVSDCVVETWDGDDVVIVTAHAAAPGAEFVMHVTSHTGEPTLWAVRVMSSTPEMSGHALRFRLRGAAVPMPRDRRSPSAPAR